MWKVLLKFNSDNTNQEIKFLDAKGYFGGYLKIKRTYFNKLIKIIKITKNYSKEKAIEKVLSPEKENWTNNPWMLILVQDIEKEKNFWFLIKREKDLSGLLVAIGPEEFIRYNKSNSEAKREIMQIINFIITYYNKFKVIILLPNFLS
jgi:hypothetical protein